ncbi:MAG: hypothetical protein UU24_C0037G0002 [Candidatus Nomurabacteria bacterium GW2011_GWA2_40_9]|uniref:VanZ-like domain-containing protein n=1 Tax=Candidatus Nomurabacteria bacterium GW2011_GWA2_40_9 TaxID=1618734 RepID=A0A0G0W299_9BACT|nr:MAG: hypothetical protein UU24_C0037G0002 [Candidatus Nomurabacteria bacterium GW2011_GWA2_40_9]
MNRKKLFIRLATLMFLIFTANFVANKFYWYSSISYFDMIMHFLGGFWLALAFIWVYNKEKLNSINILKVMLSVLLVGVAWEVFEVLVNQSLAKNLFDALDTLSDLFFDLFGGVTALYYVSKRIMKKKEDKV